MRSPGARRRRRAAGSRRKSTERREDTGRHAISSAERWTPAEADRPGISIGPQRRQNDETEERRPSCPSSHSAAHERGQQATPNISHSGELPSVVPPTRRRSPAVRRSAERYLFITARSAAAHVGHRLTGHEPRRPAAARRKKRARHHANINSGGVRAHVKSLTSDAASQSRIEYALGGRRLAGSSATMVRLWVLVAERIHRNEPHCLCDHWTSTALRDAQGIAIFWYPRRCKGECSNASGEGALSSRLFRPHALRIAGLCRSRRFRSSQAS